MSNQATGAAYWQMDLMDAYGNVAMETLGNGQSTLRTYDKARGHIDSILTGTVLGTEVQSLNYEWDALGNLKSRRDANQEGLEERFYYDDLNRLERSTLNGVENLALEYDSIGNIKEKSSVGVYHYDGVSPHAVTSVTGTRAATYSYDTNGNMLSGDGRSITWNAFNKPEAIYKGNDASFLTYGPDRNRVWQVTTGSRFRIMVYVSRLYEVHFTHEGVTEARANILVGDRVVATEVTRDNGTSDTLYLHRDHLGSVDVITDAADELGPGDIVERHSFDAFGKRRIVMGWQDDINDGLSSVVALTFRGFTDHEHLDTVGLIHMNGRVYDPVLGRFLSPDPHVQFPESTQGLNRYTYVNNNPLSYTDPSGYFLLEAAAAIAAFVATHQTAIAVATIAVGLLIDNPTLTSIGFALIPGSEFGVALLAGFGAGFISSGGSLEAGFFAAVTTTAFYGVGQRFGNVDAFTRKHLAKTITHGAVGGATNALRGGEFKGGFWSATAAQAFAPALDSPVGDDIGRQGRIITASVIGGTAAELGGGKFANGAVTGAFSRAFNDEAHLLARAKAEAQMAGNFLRDEGLDVLYRSATTVGGSGQILLGGALCATAAGCAAGAPLAALGASNIQEGLTGQPGFIRQGATSLLGGTAGNLTVDTTNIVSSGAGLLRPVLRPDTFKLFNNISSDFAPAYTTATRTGLRVEIGAGGLGAANTIEQYYDR